MNCFTVLKYRLQIIYRQVRCVKSKNSADLLRNRNKFCWEAERAVLGIWKGARVFHDIKFIFTRKDTLVFREKGLLEQREKCRRQTGNSLYRRFGNITSAA